MRTQTKESAVQPDTAQIQLRAPGGGVAFALVDAGDLPMLQGFHWTLTKEGYAHQNSKRAAYRMHRMIMGMANNDGRQVDHINRNRLDNRRANLREVTNAQNRQNLPAMPGSTSRFRGVSWDRATKTWIAQCRKDDRIYWLGRFTSEVQAARVAERFRTEHLPFAEPDPELALVPPDRGAERAPLWISVNQWAVLEAGVATATVRTKDFAGLRSPVRDTSLGDEGARNLMRKLHRRGMFKRVGPGIWSVTAAGRDAIRLREREVHEAALETEDRIRSDYHQEARHAA
jgi:hypothetical protein